MKVFVILILLFTLLSIAPADDIWLKTGQIIRNVQITDTTNQSGAEAIIIVDTNGRQFTIFTSNIFKVENIPIDKNIPTKLENNKSMDGISLQQKTKPEIKTKFDAKRVPVSIAVIGIGINYLLDAVQLSNTITDFREENDIKQNNHKGEPLMKTGKMETEMMRYTITGVICVVGGILNLML